MKRCNPEPRSEPEIVQIFEVRAILSANAIRLSIPILHTDVGGTSFDAAIVEKRLGVILGRSAALPWASGSWHAVISAVISRRKTWTGSQQRPLGSPVLISSRPGVKEEARGQFHFA
jgi:hypothetical protein